MDDVRMAEQALLGGLILEPARLVEVADWLSSADFEAPVCGLLYGRMLQLAAARSGPVDGLMLVDNLRASGDLRPDGYPISELAGWLADVPVPAALPQYGRLVVQAAVCRRVERAGVRIAELAGSGSMRALRSAVADERSAVDVQWRRWLRLAPEDVPTVAAPAPLRMAPPPPAVAPPAELAVVGSVLLSPSELGRLSWLQPGDFDDPALGAVFRRMSSMAATSVAIDRVTVAAQLSRHGDLPELGARELLATAEEACGLPAAAGRYGSDVLEAAVRRRATVLGEEIARVAAARRGGAPTVVMTAAAGLRALDGDVRRWRRAAASLDVGEAPAAAAIRRGRRRDRSVRLLPAGRE